MLAVGAGLGLVFGWIAFFNTLSLRRTVQALQRQIVELRSQLREASQLADAETAAAAPTTAPAVSPSPPPDSPPSPPTSPPPAPRSPSPPNPVFESMRANWMTWLGGICVALAGIFLVRYSIEQGLLGPAARIAMGILGGIGLHAGAEWLRRRYREAHPAFAALAGGASITLYAAIFAALELYSLLSPGLTFALLAVVSLVTMALALLHGPVLAIIGILGAYTVPVLVASDEGSILVALIYSLIVSAAGLLLLRYVYRIWLLAGVLAGGYLWWFISLGSTDADGYRGIYLAAFAYLVLAVPVLDWLLSREPGPKDPGGETYASAGGMVFSPIAIGVALAVVAQSMSIASLGFTTVMASIVAWSPLIVLVLVASRRRTSLLAIAWGMLVTQLIAWLATSLDTRADMAVSLLTEPSQAGFLRFAAAMALLYSGGSWIVSLGRPFSHWRMSMICLAPLLWLALCYLLVSDLSASWQWSVASVLLGLVYMLVCGLRLRRAPDDASAVWLILGGHLAYSLAAAMAFREATLTLVLAAQLISLCWLLRRFRLSALNWIVKGVLAVVVARLTFNPWLLTYPTDVHWSLWTYGGSLLCCATAAAITPSAARLRRWLEAVTLHLLVLFLGAEVRYWLYDGLIFIEEFTLTEAAINTSLWGALAITYRYRASVSEHLHSLYTVCSHILMALALGSYALSLSVLNPLWDNGADVSSTPVFNLLLLAYGAPVIVAVLAYRYFDPRFERVAAMIAAGGLFIFVSLQIRHLWQGALDINLPTSNGELYTYSIVWLAMAVAAILFAASRGSKPVNQAGTVLLLVVIGKIFLIDMSDLDGLLRVASFLGLGLSLLGIAFLYQRLTQGPKEAVSG